VISPAFTRKSPRRKPRRHGAGHCCRHDAPRSNCSGGARDGGRQDQLAGNTVGTIRRRLAAGKARGQAPPLFLSSVRSEAGVTSRGGSHPPPCYAGVSVMLSPTPRREWVDAQGRPYFLWDTDMTLATFVDRLRDPDVEVRAYLVGRSCARRSRTTLHLRVPPRDCRSLAAAREVPREESTLWTWLLDWWKARGERR